MYKSSGIKALLSEQTPWIKQGGVLITAQAASLQDLARKLSLHNCFYNSTSLYENSSLYM